MKGQFKLVALAMVVASFAAHASCDDVKSSIDAKLKANGVSNYTLEVVGKDQAGQGEGKVVGQCDGGSKAIVYTRGNASGKEGGNGGAAPASATSAPAPASSSSSGK